MADNGAGYFARSASAEHDMEKGGGMRVSIDELLTKHAVRLPNRPFLQPTLSHNQNFNN